MTWGQSRPLLHSDAVLTERSGAVDVAKFTCQVGVPSQLSARYIKTTGAMSSVVENEVVLVVSLGPSAHALKTASLITRKAVDHGIGILEFKSPLRF